MVVCGCWPRSAIWEFARIRVRQAGPTTVPARERNALLKKRRIFADASDSWRIYDPPRSSRRFRLNCGDRRSDAEAQRRRRNRNHRDKDPESIRNCISPVYRSRNAILSKSKTILSDAVDVFRIFFQHVLWTLPRRVYFDALNVFNRWYLYRLSIRIFALERMHI